MRRFFFLTLALFFLFQPGFGENHEHEGHSSPQFEDADPAFKFIRNDRQWEDIIKYRVIREGHQVYLTEKSIKYRFDNLDDWDRIHKVLHGPDRLNPSPADMLLHAHAYEMIFEGASQPLIEGQEKRSEYHNYFQGNDQAKWASNVPLFNRVKYTGLYPGIDLNVYSREGNFKYDFIVSPNADPAKIQLRFEGTESIKLVDGNLKITTSVNEVMEQKPYAYQLVNGREVAVACAYRMEGNVISFVFPEGFDNSAELVIDPVLVAATYSGATSSVYGHTATWDDLGNIYAGGAGFTSGGFPATNGAFQTVQGGSRESCLTKLSPDGSARIWATYLGGSGNDYPYSLYANAAGELWVLGSSDSPNFPVTTGAFQGTNGGGADLTITRFNAGATALLGSTYIGGSGSDGLNSLNYNYGDTYRGEVIVDANNNSYIACVSQSTNFPTSTGAYQTTNAGGQDGVIVKMDPTLSTMIFGTYVGGTSNDAAYGVIEDGNNGVYICGSISSQNLSGTTGAAYSTYTGGSLDAYVGHLNSTGTTMLQASYFGTTGRDQAFFIEPDLSGNIYILGQTDNTISATTGRYNGGNGMFIAQFDANLSTHNWNATYANHSPTAFLVDQCGYIYAAGHGGSASSFPISSPAIQSTWGGFYLIVLDPGGVSMNYATYYGNGGSHVDGGTSRFDRRGIVYEATCTSGGFPTTTWAVNPTSGAGWDIAPFKIDFQLVSLSAAASASPSGVGCAPFTVTFTNNSTGNIFYWNYGDSTGIDTIFAPTHTFTDSGTYIVQLIAIDSGACVTSDTAYLTIVVNEPSVNASFTETVDCWNRTVTVNAPPTTGNTDWDMGDGNTYSSSVNFTHTYAAPGSYVITYIITDTACGNTDTATASINIPPMITAAAIASPTIGCAPMSVTFTDNGSGGNAYLWDFGDGNTASGAGPTHIYTTPGLYTATLYSVDSSTCNIIDSSSVNIQVNGNPTALVSSDIAICNGGSTQLNASGGAFYQWTPSASLSPSANVSNPVASPAMATTYEVIVTDTFGCSDTANVTVDVIHIVVDAGPVTSFCAGTGGAQLYGSVLSGGTAPYYYTWWCDSTSTFCGLDSIHDNDPIANPTQTTTYYVQVVDFNGCASNIDSTIVEVLPLPIVDAGADQYICPDSAPGTLLNPNITGAPGPFQLSWSPGIGLNDSTLLNPYARPAMTTIYTLTAISSNGCESAPTTVDTLSTVTVHVHPQPIAEAGPDRDLCLGQGLLLQGYGFGAGPNYNFEWSPATGLNDSTLQNPNAAPNATTDYILTVWSNGCPGSDTVTVNVHTLPTASAGPQTDICLGESTVLTGTAWGDPLSTRYTFNWTPGGSLDNNAIPEPTATPDSTTTYYLTATSEFGCEGPADSVTIVVKPTPVAEAGPQQVMCDGDSVQLFGSYYYTTTDSADPSQIYYAWTPGNGMISDSASQNPWVAPGQSQFYYLYLNHNTCTTLDSVLVTYIPDLGTTAEADTNIICEGESVQLTSAGGIGNPSYQWYPPNAVNDPNSPNPVATPGTNTTLLLVLSESGCSDSVEVPIQVIPSPNLAYLTSIRQGCPDLTVSFMDDSQDLMHRVWDFGDGSPISNEMNPVHTYSAPGVYYASLTGVNTGGCKTDLNDIRIEVFDPSQADFTSNPGLPSEIAMPSTRVEFYDQSANATQWRWDFGDGGKSGEQNPTHNYVEPGTYTVTLTTISPDGCKSTRLQGPFVVYTPDLFIPNVFSPNDDGVNDVFVVNYTGNQPFNVTVYDRWGARMFQSKDKHFPWNGMNDEGVMVPEGVYYYTVIVGDREFVGDVTLLR